MILQALRAQVFYYLIPIQGEMESEHTALCRTELFWKQSGKIGLGVIPIPAALQAAAQAQSSWTHPSFRFLPVRAGQGLWTHPNQYLIITVM